VTRKQLRRQLRDAGRGLGSRLGLARPVTYVVSFPKCGRTWLRLMLGVYLARHYQLARTDYLNVKEFWRDHPAIPPLDFYHDDKPYKRTPEELKADKRRYRHSNVVLLVRDPRDVALSRFYAVKHREHGEGYAGGLGEYLREPRGSFRSIVAYTRLWLAQRDVPRRFLLLRYEDLHRDAATELRRVLELLGVEKVREDLLREAIEYSRFDNMRRLEEQDAFQKRTLRAAVSGDERSYKTRKGRVGDHKAEVAPEDQAWMDAILAAELPVELGYGPAPKA